MEQGPNGHGANCSRRTALPHGTAQSPARVPDPRLDELARVFEPEKVTHATVEYLDVPAISKETLRDPAYVASLRVVDAFAHVLRLFEDETIPHEAGSIDPVRDAENVETELILSDLVVIEKGREPKSGDIVIAEVDGEWTLKFFRKKGKDVFLEAANAKYPPIRARLELRVGGVVSAVIRKYPG